MDKQLVAVYGSLRQGFGNYHHFLDGKEPLWVGRAQGFRMFSLGAFPGVVDVREDNSSVHYVGDSIVYEVYEVDEQEKAALDRLEGVPTFYYEGKVDTPAGEAAIYLLPQESIRGDAYVPSGDWAEYNRKPATELFVQEAI